MTASQRALAAQTIASTIRAIKRVFARKVARRAGMDRNASASAPLVAPQTLVRVTKTLEYAMDAMME
jgi:hypothetical protein